MHHTVRQGSSLQAVQILLFAAAGDSSPVTGLDSRRSGIIAAYATSAEPVAREIPLHAWRED